MNAEPTSSPADTQSARLLVEYDGTDFVGWARQPGRRTVESAIRDAFERIDCHEVDMRVAGRTDSGVHASAQVVSVHYAGSVDPARLVPALNGGLPADVSIRDAEPCDHAFNARRLARSRTYEYRVLTAKWPSPLRRRAVVHHPRPLDASLLDEAAAAVRGEHDFTAFTPTDTLHKHFRRVIFDSHWRREGDELVYTIRADAFLRHMVRVLMGTMLQVGRGDIEPSAFAALLDGVPRDQAFQTAPPNGLCLVHIEFDAEQNVFSGGNASGTIAKLRGTP